MDLNRSKDYINRFTKGSNLSIIVYLSYRGYKLELYYYNEMIPKKGKLNHV